MAHPLSDMLELIFIGIPMLLNLATGVLIAAVIAAFVLGGGGIYALTRFFRGRTAGGTPEQWAAALKLCENVDDSADPTLVAICKILRDSS
mmetsp:Transcript_57264/g.101555  ORF Transcript_57264/g.101555 Transcript_57264/m.101555 type:complete len:91 (+) Transcript_57264:100-372(+)